MHWDWGGDGDGSHKKFGEFLDMDGLACVRIALKERMRKG